VIFLGSCPNNIKDFYGLDSEKWITPEQKGTLTSIIFKTIFKKYFGL
jgi:hypothetical protein